MMDFSFSELVVIGLIALLVVGPKRLPELARQTGSWIGKARHFVSSVRADVERELQAEELKRMLSEQQDELKTLKGMIAETQAEVEADTQHSEHRSKVTHAQAPQSTQQSQVDDTKDLPDSTATDSTKVENDARRPSRSTQAS